MFTTQAGRRSLRAIRSAFVANRKPTPERPAGTPGKSLRAPPSKLRNSMMFPDLKWYASWESAFNGTWEDEGSIAEENPFYDANTGKIDFGRLGYSPEMPIWVFPPMAQPPGPGWPHGGLYLDGDGNGVFNKDKDFAFFAGIGHGIKFSYSPRVTREAAERRVFGKVGPNTLRP